MDPLFGDTQTKPSIRLGKGWKTPTKVFDQIIWHTPQLRREGGSSFTCPTRVHPEKREATAAAANQWSLLSSQHSQGNTAWHVASPDTCALQTVNRLVLSQTHTNTRTNARTPSYSQNRLVRSLVRDKISAASQIHAPYIHACFRIKVLYHRYVHHTHMHQSQGWRIVDMCITHTCIRVKDREHRYMHHTCMYQDQGSWINASCIYVHHRHMYQDQGSYRYVSWIYASHASGTHASRIYA